MRVASCGLAEVAGEGEAAFPPLSSAPVFVFVTDSGLLMGDDGENKGTDVVGVGEVMIDSDDDVLSEVALGFMMRYELVKGVSVVVSESVSVGTEPEATCTVEVDSICVSESSVAAACRLLSVLSVLTPVLVDVTTIVTGDASAMTCLLSKLRFRLCCNDVASERLKYP